MIVPAALASLAMSAGATAECPDASAFRAAAVRYVGDQNHAAIFVFSERRILLSPTICGVLEAITRLPKDALIEASDGFAIYIAAHELAHASGIVDETAADCEAARSFLPTAHALGVPDRAAIAMLVASARINGYDQSDFDGCAPQLIRNAE